MRCSLSVLLSFLLSGVAGQHTKFDTTAAQSNLRSSVNKMKQSLLQGDFATFADYVHPEVIKMAGSRDKLIELTKESYKILEIEGYKLSAVTVDDPATIISNSSGNLQAVIQENLTLKNKRGHLLSKSYLVALSGDMGANWNFIDTNGRTIDQLLSIFPFLSNHLIIPKKEKPTFYKD